MTQQIIDEQILAIKKLTAKVLATGPEGCKKFIEELLNEKPVNTADNGKAVDVDSFAEEVEKFRVYSYEEFVEKIDNLMEYYEGQALSNAIVSEIIEPLKAGTRSYWKAMQSKHEEVIKLSKELAALKEMYLKGKGEDQWISVETDKPEYYKSVFVFDSNYMWATAWRASNGEEDFYTISNTETIIENVTHWMPLPPPPTK